MSASDRSGRFPVVTLAVCAGIALLMISIAWLNQGRQGPLQQARYARVFRVEPSSRADGSPWRVGYCQGGPWTDYDDQLQVTLQGLHQLGWLPETPPPGLDTRDQWTWLGEHPGPFLSFESAHFWDGSWDEQRREDWAQGVRAELQRDTVDVVLAFGTWAGQALAVDTHRTPTMVMSTTDAIGAGIIESAEDSGRDHVHARCDPERYLRQARVFHKIVGFQRLGVITDGTAEGHVWNNIPDLEKVGQELGFEVVVEIVPEANLSTEDLTRNTREACARLAPRVDAVWLGSHAGLLPEHLPGAIGPLLDAGVPTYSMMGQPAVSRGVLMGIEARDLGDLGLFFAQTLASILNGVRPRDIPQVFEDPKGLVINQAVADRIRFEFPVALHRNADLVLAKIEGEGQ